MQGCAGAAWVWAERVQGCAGWGGRVGAGLCRVDGSRADAGLCRAGGAERVQDCAGQLGAERMQGCVGWGGRAGAGLCRAGGGRACAGLYGSRHIVLPILWWRVSGSHGPVPAWPPRCLSDLGKSLSFSGKHSPDLGAWEQGLWSQAALLLTYGLPEVSTLFPAPS